MTKHTDYMCLLILKRRGEKKIGVSKVDSWIPFDKSGIDSTVHKTMVNITNIE